MASDISLSGGGMHVTLVGRVFSQQGNNLRNSYQIDALVSQSIIMLAFLSKIVYHSRGNTTFVVQENTGLGIGAE